MKKTLSKLWGVSKPALLAIALSTMLFMILPSVIIQWLTYAIGALTAFFLIPLIFNLGKTIAEFSLESRRGHSNIFLEFFSGTVAVLLFLAPFYYGYQTCGANGTLHLYLFLVAILYLGASIGLSIYLAKDNHPDGSGCLLSIAYIASFFTWLLGTFTLIYVFSVWLQPI
jgi:small-conductance mechanosensitive channel